VLIATLGSLLMIPWAMKTTTAWFTCALPQLLQAGYTTAQAGDKAVLLNLGMLTACIWPGVLLIAAVFAWRHARAARQEGWRMIHGDKGGSTV